MQNQESRIKNQGGYTLIEVLVYSGILVVFLFLTVQIFVTIKLSHSYSAAFVGISKNYRFLLSDLRQTIRSASSVSSPTFGASSTTLSLNGGAITYQLDGGMLTKTDSGDDFNLTTNEVVITGLSFENTGTTSCSDVIRITITMEASCLLEGDKSLSQDFQTAISLR